MLLNVFFRLKTWDIILGIALFLNNWDKTPSLTFLTGTSPHGTSPCIHIAVCWTVLQSVGPEAFSNERVTVAAFVSEEAGL